MTRRSVAVAVTVLALAAGGVWLAQRDGESGRRTKSPPVQPTDAIASSASNAAPSPSQNDPVPESASKGSGTGKPDPRLERLADGRTIVAEAARNSASLHKADIDPARDLEALDSLFGLYRWAYNYNPEGGENNELVAALLGKNPHKLVFLPATHAKLDAEGALLDRWGTPYHFHKISDTVIDIVSAGPDRRLWTSDDLGLGRTEEFHAATTP